MHMYVRSLRKEMRKLYAIRIKSAETKKYEKEKNMKHKTIYTHRACSREAESHIKAIWKREIFFVCAKNVYTPQIFLKSLFCTIQAHCATYCNVEERDIMLI
jgi:hypothetical protein